MPLPGANKLMFSPIPLNTALRARYGVSYAIDASGRLTSGANFLLQDCSLNSQRLRRAFCNVMP